MFAKKTSTSESFSKHRSSKIISKQKRSFRDNSTSSKRAEKIAPKRPDNSPPMGSTLTSPIITLVVGPDSRLFACHEEILILSPFFAAICRVQFLESSTKRINLPEEIPEVFSSVLEYLYKGDYYPKLMHNKRTNIWELEDAGSNKSGKSIAESAVYHQATGQMLLKDTLVYCTAEKYGLEELKRLSLRKQGLQSGIQCATILASARYAYANTPDSDSKLRAHYLALIVRSRNTFKRSGTMQMEMEAGGKLFFDLFVAMANFIDDVSTPGKSPR